MTVIISGTDGVSDVDGTAGTPALRGTDANTGVFFGTDIVGVSTGGSERMRVDASGNVGIGTSSPLGKLHSSSASSGATPSANGNQLIAENSGNAGITIASGAASLGNIFFADSGDNADGFVQYDQSGRSLRFGTATAERARIDSSGNLLVGTTTATPGYGNTTVGVTIVPANPSCFSISRPDFVQVINQNTIDGSFFDLITFRTGGIQRGNILSNGSTVSYNTSSDYRLKENVKQMTGALATVVKLKPCTYTWKETGQDGQGFIAHELQAVVPDCVTGEKDAVDAEGKPQYQGIDVSFLVATLTKAIQEQQAIIESLTARVVALEQA